MTTPTAVRLTERELEYLDYIKKVYRNQGYDMTTTDIVKKALHDLFNTKYLEVAKSGK